MLLLILLVLAVVFLAGGFGVRGHESYGGYSSPGLGLGAVLLIVLLVLLLTGTLRL